MPKNPVSRASTRVLPAALVGCVLALAACTGSSSDPATSAPSGGVIVATPTGSTGTSTQPASVTPSDGVTFTPTSTDTYTPPGNDGVATKVGDPLADISEKGSPAYIASAYVEAISQYDARKPYPGWSPEMYDGLLKPGGDADRHFQAVREAVKDGKPHGNGETLSWQSDQEAGTHRYASISKVDTYCKPSGTRCLVSLQYKVITSTSVKTHTSVENRDVVITVDKTTDGWRVETDVQPQSL